MVRLFVCPIFRRTLVRNLEIRHKDHNSWLHKLQIALMRSSKASLALSHRRVQTTTDLAMDRSRVSILVERPSDPVLYALQTLQRE